MVEVNEKKRLRGIKSFFCLFEAKCNYCGKSVKFKMVWTVNRHNPTFPWSLDYYYCKECMPTKKDVLNEIDTDEIGYGIEGIDNNYNFVKKDDTRLRKKNQESLKGIEESIKKIRKNIEKSNNNL